MKVGCACEIGTAWADKAIKAERRLELADALAKAVEDRNAAILALQLGFPKAEERVQNYIQSQVVEAAALAEYRKARGQ